MTDKEQIAALESSRAECARMAEALWEISSARFDENPGVRELAVIAYQALCPIIETGKNHDS